jgi:hypothetical protein
MSHAEFVDAELQKMPVDDDSTDDSYPILNSTCDFVSFAFCSVATAAFLPTVTTFCFVKMVSFFAESKVVFARFDCCFYWIDSLLVNLAGFICDFNCVKNSFAD